MKKILVIILLLLVAVLITYRKPILQEGNPLPILSGIIKLNFTTEKLIPIDESGKRYIAKSENGIEAIKQLMSKKGYKLVDQLGAGYVFEKDDISAIVVTHHHYSRFYNIWYFPPEDFISDLLFYPITL